MTADVVSAPLGTSVRDAARLMIEKHVSAIPVLAADQQVVGMVSEGDLLGRNDEDRVARRDWWLALLEDGQTPAKPLDMLIALPVERVMRAPVVTIEARAPLHEIAAMLGAYDIKRLPVMRDGRMVGIVSRSDLVRAMATMTPQAAAGRSEGVLFSLFGGMMKHESRPADASASASAALKAAERPSVTAEAFHTLVATSQQAETDDAIAAKAKTKLDHDVQVKAMLKKHVGARMWTNLLDRAQTAAASGEKSFELIRFPCDLCSDGGRSIGVPEDDWPTTLRGEAAEMYTRWEQELRPVGFGLRAQIAEYHDGLPSEVALSLTWKG